MLDLLNLVPPVRNALDTSSFHQRIPMDHAMRGGQAWFKLDKANVALHLYSQATFQPVFENA